LDDEAVWPGISRILDVVVVIAAKVKPLENLGYEKDPICRTDVRGLEHSAEYFLEKVVFGVVPWLEISSLERLVEA